VPCIKLSEFLLTTKDIDTTVLNWQMQTAQTSMV